MPIDIGTYAPFQPGGLGGPLHERPRKDAKREFDLIMAQKEERLDQLAQLVAPFGITLDGSDEQLDRLDYWFRANATLKPDDDDRMESIWYAIAFDIALYIGEIMIRRFPALHWAFYDKGGKRNISFQRHVIMGYTGVRYPNLYDTDPGLWVAAHGLRAAKGMDNRDTFSEFVKLQSNYL